MIAIGVHIGILEKNLKNNMAREEIIENINTVLNKSVEKERVVYLMVEVRKYIERTEEVSKKWNELKYWCDWIVHTQMERKFAKATLIKMEEFIVNNPNSKFNHSYFNNQFFSLESLRHQLYEFLMYNNLPTEITNIPPWEHVSKYIVETLRDCPLQKNTGLVRKFFFSKKEHIPEAEELFIDWELIFDGTRPNLWGTVLRSSRHKES